jgi:hypothetical protein
VPAVARPHSRTGRSEASASRLPPHPRTTSRTWSPWRHARSGCTGRRRYSSATGRCHPRTLPPPNSHRHSRSRCPLRAPHRLVGWGWASRAPMWRSTATRRSHGT